MTAHPILPTLPRRPSLRPGLRVVHRDDGHLQVGTDPPHRVVLADAPDVRRLLDELRVGGVPTPTTPSAFRCLMALLKAGLIVDADEVESAALGATTSGVSALYARFGPAATDRLAARRDSRVAVDASGESRESVVRLLRAAGANVADDLDDCTLRLIIRDHEVARHDVDALVRDGVAHLLVTAADGGFTVGPFVVPGLTACLRCVDAHLAETDPRRSIVVEQAARSTPAGGVEPRDPVLHSLALAWAVRDLISFVEGDQPATWSASVSFGLDPVPTLRTWTRHPHCGCSWDGLGAAG